LPGKIIVSTSFNPQTNVSADGLLAGAGNSLQTGNRESAYLLSLEATRLEPDNIEAWLMRFRTAFSSEEKLLCLSQVIRLDPDHPDAKKDMYAALWGQFHSDPYLAYIEETDRAYFVRHKDHLILAVPKDRLIPESYTPRRVQFLGMAYRWLTWAFLGMATAGLGTLLCAPVAIWFANRALDLPLEQIDSRRAWMAIILSGLLIVIALFFGWIFLIHVLG